MGFWYHPIEETTLGAVVEYEGSNPDSVYDIRFSDGEHYVGRFSNLDAGADNSNDLDIDMDDPRYDEFYQLDFELSDDSARGHRNYNEYLCVDYRDFPSSITNAITGEVVYPLTHTTADSA